LCAQRSIAAGFAALPYVTDAFQSPMNDLFLTSRAQGSTREPAFVPARASILLVDDKPARLLTYEAILSGLEVNCVRAHSGTEALEKLMAQSFAVILLDVQMPDIDGFEVARLIRQHPRLERMPIIFVTGVNVDQLDVLRGYEVGAIDYIAVPVVPEILRSKVAVLIELYQRRAELQRLNAELAMARTQLADEFSRDTADHRRTEAALRDSERIFKALVENATVGVARNTLDGEFLYTNPGFCQMVGYGADELGQLTWQQITHPDDLEMDLAQVKRLLAGEDSSYTIEKRYIRKDGRIVWVSLHGSFVRSDDDKTTTAMAVVVDITERRQADDKLRLADRRKDEFLAMLAHELRNPVAPILSVAEALKHLPGRDDRQQALVGIVQRQASHLSRLLDDLLDVARITQGRIQLRREVVALSDCVAAACESIDPLVRARHQMLRVEQDGGLWLDADRVRVAQCIGNLLSNAAKYSEPGSEIFLRTWRDGNHAVLTVRDDGAGIAPELLPHVFELFAQDERALDRTQGGLGIGLTVTRNLIQMHGGDVTAASDGPGRGATFTIRLPLTEQGVEAASTAPVTGKVRRVLVIDDNRDAADSMAVLLQLDGHEVAAVYSSGEGLLKTASFAPDIVLLDIGLPQMDGYEVARRLIETGFKGRLIAISGYGEEHDKQRAAAAGFFAHLSKPVDYATLEKVMAAP
jgi:PAS domain S-box-containing protein